MVRELRSLRDFLDDEQLKWLPGNFQLQTCVLLVQNVITSGTARRVVQVFSDTGTWIGTIENPDWIPSKK